MLLNISRPVQSAVAVFAALWLCCLPALAHHSEPGALSAGGWKFGLLHPLTGLDHILAMVGVGLWAAQLGGRAVWLLPASFITLMLVGGGLGFAQAPLPAVEAGIAVSVIVLGLALAVAVRWPVWAGAGLCGLFAILHGHAHGQELAAGSSLLAYFLGFALTTAGLHLAGIGVGLAIGSLRSAAPLRVAGLGLAGCGAVLFAMTLS